VRADVVVAKLRRMNPLNKGIESIPDLGSVDMAHFAVCVIGAVKFTDIDQGLIFKFEQQNLKYIINVPFGFGGMIYSSLTYQDNIGGDEGKQLNDKENIELDLEVKDSVNIENNVDKINLGKGEENKDDDALKDKENGDKEIKDDCLN